MAASIKKSNILIVDDMPENIDVLNNLLKDHYEITAATNGKKALDLIQKGTYPDLILLDIMMPESDGFQMAQQLRMSEKTKDIPIIFITSLGDRQNILQGFQAGGQDYVIKPFDPVELLARVKTHLDLKMHKDQLKSMNQFLEKKVQERTYQLEKSLKEKEMLLTELHHRVRNNLQMISSMLNLQRNYVKNEETLHTIKANRNRLQSMFLVHNMVNSEKDLIGINFSQYVKSLIFNLYQNNNYELNRVKPVFKIKDIQLNINILIPCGMIISELVSFIIDRFITKQSGGEIIVSFLKDKKDRNIIVVKEVGLNFKDDIDFQNSKNFSLKLVHVLTQQLQGEIIFNKQNEEFKLIFEDPEIRTYNPINN